jgi:hemerythrin-like domain-containing protein
MLAVTATAGATWADAALDYAALLPGHMAKENQILFVIAEKVAIHR